MEKKLITLIYLYFTFHLCVGFITNFFTQKDGVVKTEKGLVQGVLLTTITEGRKYYAFRGIPYAKAPVGHLRFKVQYRKLYISKIQYFCTKKLIFNLTLKFLCQFIEINYVLIQIIIPV